MIQQLLNTVLLLLIAPFLFQDHVNICKKDMDVAVEFLEDKSLLALQGRLHSFLCICQVQLQQMRKRFYRCLTAVETLNPCTGALKYQLMPRCIGYMGVWMPEVSVINGERTREQKETRRTGTALLMKQLKYLTIDPIKI